MRLEEPNSVWSTARRLTSWSFEFQGGFEIHTIFISTVKSIKGNGDSVTAAEVEYLIGSRFCSRMVLKKNQSKKGSRREGSPFHYNFSALPDGEQLFACLLSSLSSISTSRIRSSSRRSQSRSVQKGRTQRCVGWV